MTKKMLVKTESVDMTGEGGRCWESDGGGGGGGGWCKETGCEFIFPSKTGGKKAMFFLGFVLLKCLFFFLNLVP